MRHEVRERVGGGIHEGVDPLRVGAGLAVSALLVGVLVVVVGPERLLALLRSADPLPLGGAMTAALAGLFLRGWAAAVLYGASSARAVGARFYLLYAFATLPKHVMPGGYAAGPAVSAYVLSRDSGGRFGSAFASFGVAELLNVVASLVVAVVGVSLLVVVRATTPGEGIRLVVAGGVGLAALAAATLLLARSEWTVSALVRAGTAVAGTLGRFPPTRHLQALVAGRGGVRGREFARTARLLADDRRTVSGSLAISTAAALVSALPLYFCLVAIDAPASLAVVLVVVPVAGLLGATPLPGGIGGVELAMAGLLVALGGFDPGRAAAATLIYRLSTFGVITLLGAVAAGVLTATGGRPRLS